MCEKTGPATESLNKLSDVQQSSGRARLETENVSSFQATSHYLCSTGFPGGSDGKASACNEEDPGSIPGSGRSPGEGNGNPLQYSCLENSMDGGAW